jgi:anion-transporting  ArsA/GET3 family ATPase
MSGDATAPVAPQAPRLDIDAALVDRGTRIIVCCGSGGVGKTTTAAALGLRAAELGRDVCVLTIDPARRLAQSMGLDELDNEPRRVVGVSGPDGTGSLDAMMLDMKRTFDEMVEAHADPDKAAEILANPFYEALSSSFAGTQEYMAMEKLGHLRAQSDEEGRWDLIVVDTPPSRSALDFLDAPKRMGTFLDGRFIKILTAPGRGIGRLMSAGFGMFTSVLNKVIGASVLVDLQAFVTAFEALFGGFRQRAEKTYALLQDPGTSFVVVAAPERDALREASYFVERLEAERMPLAGLVLNRVQALAYTRLSEERAVAGAERLEAEDEHPVTAALLRLHGQRLANHARQSHLAERFVAAHPSVPLVEVPALAGDVHDLEGLREIGDLLAGS